MLTEQEIVAANDYGEWMRLAVHDKYIPASNRVRAAAGCLIIAQDHHHAIVTLLDVPLYASCFSLVRVAFEAYIRGEWLALCATDKAVDDFISGEEPPKVDKLLQDIEGVETFNDQNLSKIKRHTWRSLCAYTHTGGLHVQRWNTAEGIEPNYSRAEVAEVLRFAEIILALSVLGMARIMKDEALAERVWERFSQRVQE